MQKLNQADKSNQDSTHPTILNMEKFQKIFTNFLPELNLIENIILEFAVGKSPLIHEVTKHLISSGGKRIRPILLILASKLCGSESDNKNVLGLAAAIELIHSATLLHDDVVDASMMRRGRKTSNAIWDNKASILVGDYLFSIAFQLMVLSKNFDVLALLSKTSSIMSDGEVMQLQNSNNITLSESDYFNIIFGKTAALFSAACEVGALINNRSQQEITALNNFGKNLGIIFQITDDILDYSSDEKTFGKEKGGDFFEGKVTLPIILTYEKSSDAEKKMISEIFLKNNFSDEKNQKEFDSVFDLIKKYDGLETSKNMALLYKTHALENLKIFPDSQKKDDLLTILEYSLARIS